MGGSRVIEYLEHLLKTEEWAEALDYGEQLLLSHSHDSDAMGQILLGIAKSRYYLSEFHGAFVSAKSALRIAEAGENWNLYGESCILSGTSCGMLGFHENAVSTFYDYLSRRNDYGSARGLESVAWYNLGIALSNTGNLKDAADAYDSGLKVALRTGNHRDLHALRLALAKIMIKANEHKQVSRLLAQDLAYLNRNAGAEMIGSRLYHLHLRAECALGTGRSSRAAAIAERGLRLSQALPRHKYNFLMSLATIALQSGRVSDALGYMLSARIAAVQVRRFDLEYHVSLCMYELASGHPEALSRMAAISDLEPLPGFQASDFGPSSIVSQGGVERR